MEKNWGTNDDAAVGALENVMQRQPDYPEARQKLYARLIARADRYLGLGDRESAYTTLMRAVDLIPQGGEARHRLSS
jgi:hypothetical protein